MDPGNPALNIAARWRLEGRVSTLQLEQALARLVARHAALRASFTEDDGEPVQVIGATAFCRLRDIDLSGEPAIRARPEVERIARLEGRAPFDLSAPPLMRVTHIRLAGCVSILLVTVHRLVCDAASVGILARELAALCAALHAGRPCDLPEAPRSAEPASRGAGQQVRDEAYWSRALRLARHFELPPDRTRPPALTFDGERVSLRLERGVCEALQDVSRRAGCGLFTTALAALFTLLHRYSGETDIAVGSPVAGRGEAELETVGAYADTLVLRADLSGDPSFSALLERVHSGVTAGLLHRGTPLARLIELLQPRRDLSRHALFSIHFAFQPTPIRTESGGAFCLVDEPAPPAGVLHDLDFQVTDTGDGWTLGCEYNTALYDAATASGLLAHFANLLRAVAADPARSLSVLPILDADQQRVLAADGNRTAAAYPAAATLVRLFDGQVHRTPGAIALVCGERTLSYRKLDAASSALADVLVGRGIGRGSRVGVCLERSPELVVALLAVLKSGAAYVPLDPAYPPARLAQIVGDAQPAAVLTKGALRDRLPATDAALILLDAGVATPAARDRPPGPIPGPDDVAYVIYTSGSTGQPKGVQVRHRALTNLLWSMSGQPGLAAADTLVAVTTVCFDIAALELFLPLIVGARLVLAQTPECADGEALLQLLRRHRATVMQATPATWQLLLAAGWRADPPLRMWCGGEALSRTLADRLCADGGELWNLYGPTETTIWSSALRVEAGAGPVPLGPPIANTQFHVLDAQGQLVPAGVAGELFIGGDGVALGYLNLPALTRERFVPDPFRELPGATLYRTGDRVRRRARGTFEYLGRADDQVKVRGFRIELGEVDAALRAHPQVGDAVAVAGLDAAGETAVRAWLVARGATVDAAAFVDSVRTAVRQTLPGYMCPASFAVLASLPRLPNGKIDRAALASRTMPAVDAVGAQRAATPAEAQLAPLWCAVLGVPAVGLDSNFFEVGGHSLLAVRLLARIEASFGRKLSLAALFQHPTVAGQARLLEHGEARAFDFRQVVALQSGGSRPPLIALNNTGIYFALSRRLGPDQPFTSLQLFDPALPARALPRTLQDIAAGYADLIRRVHGPGPYALLGWCVAGTLAFEVARQLRRSGAQVSRLILFDTLAPGRLDRLSWHAALLAEYSYRWKLIAADWRRARRGARPLAAFLSNRTIVRKLLGDPLQRGGAPGPEAASAPEQYDRWLLGYLEEAAAGYEPRPYAGSVTLFRSSQEPAGRFLDPQLGWGEFVEGVIEVAVIEGDHFSIFQEPAVAQVAQLIDSALRPEGP